MKRFSILGCIAAALLSLAGCEPSGNDDYEGTNYIYLDSEGGKTSLLGLNDNPITVNVTLTASLEEDLILNFVINDDQNILEVTGNPVTIPAGSKKASFTIGVADVEELQASSNFTVTLAEDAVLPEKVQLKSDFSFSVVVIEVPELTAEQNTILSTYMAATGINLAKYIGEVNVTTMISGLDAGTGAPFEKPIESKTLITLSETSTADAPVLKMLVNPMGIQDYMYSVMKAVTVEDMVYWFPEEYALECYAIFTEAIGWNAESIETFTASLDGITFGADGEITFVQDYLNIYDEESIIVPFEFSFTAFDREKAADFSDAAVKPGDDEWQPDCTADPAVHLNLSGISYDEFELEGEGYYVEPSAVIDENGNLVFTFCFDHKNAEDYTRVVATYTPNN